MIGFVITFYSILLGFIMGSFLNVVSLRFNTGKSLSGRSQCFSCSKKLHWYELIPVFSWLMQKGRCRGCSVPIPKEVFASEFITGVFFGIIGGRGALHGVENLLSFEYLISTLYLFFVFSTLMVILFYDMRHKIIPDTLSALFAVTAFLGMFFFGMDHGFFTFVGFHIPPILHFLAPLLISLPFALVWYFSKGRLIGLGDPKLMLGMGLLLGFSFGMSAVFLAFWIGSFFALGMYLLSLDPLQKLFPFSKKGILKLEIPFAPFLIIGTLIAVSFGFNFLLLN